MKRILLIDEEKEPMKYYLMALKQANYELIVTRTTDAAIKFLTDDNNQCPDLCILDYMLPPGNRYKGNPDCNQGMSTGRLLYNDIRGIYPDLPIIILTNSRDAFKEMKIINPNIPVLQKIENAPFDLVEFIKEVLAKS